MRATQVDLARRVTMTSEAALALAKLSGQLGSLRAQVTALKAESALKQRLLGKEQQLGTSHTVLDLRFCLTS
jgi:hypothetical protein